MSEAPDIDFVRPRGRLLAWAAAGLLTVGVALAVVSYLGYRADRRDVDAAMKEAQQRLAASQVVQPAPALSAEPAWLKEAGASVAEDWNALFDRIEGLKVSGVRLVSVQAGLHPRSVRVEFELDGWTRVSELNEALNRPGEPMRWDLVSVAPAGGSGPMSGGVRAVWQR